MKPVHIKDANADYAKPKDWDEATMGPCGSLPIRREVIGTPGSGAYLSMKSNWKPNADELRILNRGGAVELECCGVQPAVSVAAVECADPEARGYGVPPHAEHCNYPAQGCICRAWETSPLG